MASQADVDALHRSDCILCHGYTGTKLSPTIVAQAIEAISDDLRAIERSLSLTEHRAPDPTFSAIAYAWVSGEGFAEIVAEEELTGGDFVRNMKQLIDLLRQIATVAPSEATRRAAAEAVAGAYRGVVADSAAG